MGPTGPYSIPFGPSGPSGSIWTLLTLLPLWVSLDPLVPWTCLLGMYAPLVYVWVGAQDVPSHLLPTFALFGVIWDVKPHHHPMGQVHRMS